MAKTPLESVRERFGGKKELVEAVRKLATNDLWLDRVRGAGLDRVSNQKLLRLHARLETLKAEYGSRDKLIEAIRSLEKRTKDQGFRDRLEKLPVPRLLDLVSSAKRRQKQAQRKQKAA